MGIGSLSKVSGNRIIGIDASTNSLAFAVIENKVPIRCGEVFFNGATVFERLKDAKDKTKSLVDSQILIGDYIAIEAAIKVNSPKTFSNLSYVYGAIIGELMASNPQVHEIYPITWQTGIGNPNLKTAEKDAIQKANPGKSKSWYQNEGRKIRKGKTLEIARKHFSIPSNSDNIGDAVGLALYCSEKLIRP